MDNVHIITAEYFGYTETKPARIKIHSARFKQTVFVSVHEYETGADWLRANGFKVIASGLLKHGVALVSTTFKPLKDEKKSKGDKVRG